MPPKYADDPTWDDIDPLPQDDGGPNPLAAIAYTEEYSEAMAYLRAVMSKNEFSERVLRLTEDIIDMNPAHYTVWLYRAKTLFALRTPLSTEIRWLNALSLRHQKNYQIWHHRQLLIDRIDSAAGEIDFLTQMFEKDAKNYHVWSYRQWVVRRFGLWEGEGELEKVESMLRRDVRNNSAWNHRWFLVFGREGEGEGEGNGEGEVGREVLEREVEFAKQAIRQAPQNQSPWNYLRGLLRKSNSPLSTLSSFAGEFASLDNPDEVASSHALDLLADIHAEQERNEDAAKALDLLAKRFDPIRANYWNYRKSLLGLRDDGVAA